VMQPAHGQTLQALQCIQGLVAVAAQLIQAASFQLSQQGESTGTHALLHVAAFVVAPS
jgi:hypothetical protein